MVLSFDEQKFQIKNPSNFGPNLDDITGFLRTEILIISPPAIILDDV